MKTKTQRTAKPGARSHPEKGQNKFGGGAVVFLSCCGAFVCAACSEPKAKKPSPARRRRRKTRVLVATTQVDNKHRRKGTARVLFVANEKQKTAPVLFLARAAYF